MEEAQAVRLNHGAAGLCATGLPPLANKMPKGQHKIFRSRPLKALLLILAALVALPGMAAQEDGKNEMNGSPKTLKWAGCGITKKAFMKELALAYEKIYGVHFELEGGGATKGIRRVHNREVDIGGSCRNKIPGVAEERGVRMSPVAWDALVVMTHPDNPVADITLQQLKKVYEGKIRNWKELGGRDAPIELLVRSSKISGVGKTLRDLVWADPDKEFKGSEEFPSSGPLEKAVESRPNALGISGISSARKRQVKLLSLEGKAPTFDNIRNGHYLLYRPLYITYLPRNNPRIKEIKRFISFAHSKQGREIIRTQGVVPYLDAMGLTSRQREQWKIARDLIASEE